MTGDQLLFTMIVTPALEEAVVDFLLGLGHDQGFNTCHVNGHSSRHSGLSLTEQVAGRRKQIRFDLVVAAAEFDDLLELLKRQFGYSDVHYWAVPVVRSGRL